jgi:hypothetical protein
MPARLNGKRAIVKPIRALCQFLDGNA